MTLAYDEGTVIVLPEPTRDGYTFDCWEGSRHEAGEEYTVEGDHTFKAQWKKDGAPTTRHTITYDLNGGTYQGSSDNIVEHHEKGGEIEIHPAPVRDGYNFLYWKGSEYQPGDKYTVVGDHVFVAQWERAPGPGPGPAPNPAPRTGDAMSPMLLLALALLASLSLAILRVASKRR